MFVCMCVFFSVCLCLLQSQELDDTCPSVPCYNVEDDLDVIIAVTVTASVLLPILLAVLGGIVVVGLFLWRCRAQRAGPLESLNDFVDMNSEGLMGNPLFVSGEITAENAAFESLQIDQFDV
jgi:hypothetical protein